MSDRLPNVLILGRPNVGKSTLFNRLLGRRVALTHDAPHTTRDVLAAPCAFGDVRFELLDAAGYLATSDDSLQESIKRGLAAAAAAADLILLVFDGRGGLVAGDHELASYVRRLRKPVLPVVNKIDGPAWDVATADFHAFGFKRAPVPVGAKSGYNVLGLLATVAEMLPGVAAPGEEGAPRRIAIVGRPNVGKSSLLNRLAGIPRVVVHEEPGTTRDAVDVTLTHDGRHYVFVDTAGIRRRTRAKGYLESWSLAKSLAAIRRAQLVILVLDGAEGPTTQDAKIAGYAHDRGRGLVVFMNKTDLFTGGAAAFEARLAEARAALKFASYAPIIGGSAREGFDVRRVYSVIEEVSENYGRRVGTGELNRFVERRLSERRWEIGGKATRVLFAVQVDVTPPAFHFFLNLGREPSPEYGRFVENRLRGDFPFVGTPLRITFRLRPRRGG